MSIQVNGRSFRLYLSQDQIKQRIDALGAELRQQLTGREVVFIVILKGSIFTAADVIRSYGQSCTIEAVRARSYRGMASSGTVEISMTDTVDLKGKTVVIIEDIVETGRTLQAIHHHLSQSGAQEVLTLSLLRKPSAMKNPIPVDFVGFDIEQAFVIGYGLDYDEEARYLADIYQLEE